MIVFSEDGVSFVDPDTDQALIVGDSISVVNTGHNTVWFKIKDTVGGDVLYWAGNPDSLVVNTMTVNDVEKFVEGMCEIKRLIGK